MIEKAGKAGEEGVSTCVQNEEKVVCREQQGVVEKKEKKKEKETVLLHILPQINFSL